MKIVKKIALVISGLIATVIISLVIHNLVLTAKYKKPFESKTLSESEIIELQFISELQKTHGDNIWPGFRDADIPILFFNNTYEFMVGVEDSDSTWYMANNQPFDKKILYTRKAVNSQAFAVNVGSQWAGSIGIYQQMNREMIFGIRSQTPPVATHLIPFFLFTISPDMHVSSTVHEMFHAYQAESNEEKFLSAEAAHAQLHNYPYGDSLFADYWNREGSYLEKALYANGNQEMAAYVDSFLITRALRREHSGLSQEVIEAEKQLEWLEGLAKYAESKAYTAASSMESNYKFKEKQPYWELERKQQLSKLGKLGGDNRFYHSGAAQAFILDRINPDWKLRMMQDNNSLEDLFHGKFCHL